MPFDDEPRNGDFAAYVERLANRSAQAGVAPALAQEDDHADEHREAYSRLRIRQPSPAVEVIRHDHNSHTEFEYVPVTSQADGDAGVAHGSQRKDGPPRLLGLVQIVLGMGTLVLLINAIERARYSDTLFTPENLVPIGLFTFIAGMFLLRGRARLHQAQARKAAARAARRQSGAIATPGQRRNNSR